MPSIIRAFGKLALVEFGTNTVRWIELNEFTSPNLLRRQTR